MERLKILHSDTDWHLAFFHFVETIFSGGRVESWTAWRDRGGWTADYEVFALVEDGALVGTIGRSRMTLVIEGEARTGYQLGAVAVLPRCRGRGLSHVLMNWLIGSLDTPDQPVILFANSRVHDFYPRFGFQRLFQRRSLAATTIRPSSTPTSRCDLSSAADRARLLDLCARATPTRGRLTARGYGWLALWNLTCGPMALAWLPEHDAAVAVTIEGETLVVHDVLAPAPFDLRRVAPTLINSPVTSVELLIDPEEFWPSMAHAVRDDGDSPLFARGAAAAIGDPVQFTPLAQT